MQVVTLCISTSLVLILLGLVVFTGLTARNLSAYVKENLAVTVLFGDNVSNREAAVLCNKMRKKHYVTKHRKTIYITSFLLSSCTQVTF